MADSEESGDASDDEGKRQLRLLGAGFVISGLLIYGLSGAADPPGLLIPLLGFLGLAALVLQGTQGVTHGTSFGLFTGAVAVWLWPTLRTAGQGYDYLGLLVVAIGLLNVVLAPVGLYFRRLGERLGERTRGAGKRE